MTLKPTLFKTAAVAAYAAVTLTACVAPSSGGNDIKPVGGGASTSGSAPVAAKSTAAKKNTHTVVYEVTSDAATAASVSYFTVSGSGQSGQEQAQDAALPFSKTFEVGGGSFFGGAYSLTAQAADGATTISCKITVDGAEKANQTSTGQFSVVSCSAG